MGAVPDESMPVLPGAVPVGKDDVEFTAVTGDRGGDDIFGAVPVPGML